MATRLAVVLSIALAHSLAVRAQAPGDFRFETITSLDEMSRVIQAQFPLGASRDAVRRAFVDQGKATLKIHPGRSGVEKYLFDINLCSYYVWRWNISADFDGGGRLVQGYVNGEPVFPTGPQKKDAKDFKGERQSIYKVMRPRPEASKGENQLAFMLLDADSDTSTIDDELAMGAGPSRPDPVNAGQLHMYANVDPWRSIFDKDDAARVASFAGDCKEADELYARQKAAAQGRWCAFSGASREPRRAPTLRRRRDSGRANRARTGGARRAAR